MFLPEVFFPPEGVLAQLAWYPMLWCDTTQSTVSRVLVWSSMFFKLKVFQHKKNNLSFLEISGGFPPDSHQFPIEICSLQILPELSMFFFAVHTGSCCCCRWHQPHFTPSESCNTRLCCQKVLKLPESKIPPSCWQKPKPMFRLITIRGWKSIPKEGLGIGNLYIYTYTKIMYIHTYIHTYRQTDRQTYMQLVVSSK